MTVQKRTKILESKLTFALNCNFESKSKILLLSALIKTIQKCIFQLEKLIFLSKNVSTHKNHKYVFSNWKIEYLRLKS